MGSFNNRHSARELKYRNLSLRNHYHNNIFAHCFLFRNSGFLFVLLLTMFLVIKRNTRNETKNSKTLHFFCCRHQNTDRNMVISVLLLLGCGVELNPGPKQSSINTFSVCHWNLISMCAHNYAKIFLLKPYIAIHKFDIICIPETYLDSNTSHDDNNLEISDYNLMRSAYLSNNKQRGICIYHKHLLSWRILNGHKFLLIWK